MTPIAPLHGLDIQPGHPDDAAAASALICATDRSLYAYLSGGKLARIEALVGACWRSRGCLLSHRLARVVRSEGELLGVVVSYTAEQHAELPQFDEVGLVGRFAEEDRLHLQAAMATAQFLFPAVPAGALYIQNLAVAAAARKQGAGRALMASALASGRESRCDSCHLDVERDNEGAVAFYHKLGFTVLVETTMPALARQHGLPPHYRMVCSLT